VDEELRHGDGVHNTVVDNSPSVFPLILMYLLPSPRAHRR